MDKLQKTIEYLRDQGRFGDTDLVHVNPQEKAMLKAMGGAGTINPNTGLEEYFLGGFFSNPIKAVTHAVSNLGSSIDDLVHDVVPGGWATVGALGAGGLGMVFAPEIAAGLESAGLSSQAANLTPEMVNFANASADPIGTVAAISNMTPEEFAALEGIG